MTRARSVQRRTIIEKVGQIQESSVRRMDKQDMAQVCSGGLLGPKKRMKSCLLQQRGWTKSVSC